MFYIFFFNIFLYIFIYFLLFSKSRKQHFNEINILRQSQSIINTYINDY